MLSELEREDLSREFSRRASAVVGSLMASTVVALSAAALPSLTSSPPRSSGAAHPRLRELEKEDLRRASARRREETARRRGGGGESLSWSLMEAGVLSGDSTSFDELGSDLSPALSAWLMVSLDVLGETNIVERIDWMVRPKYVMLLIERSFHCDTCYYKIFLLMHYIAVL